MTGPSRSTRRLLLLGSKPLGLRCLGLLHELCPEALLGAVTFDDRDDVRNAFEDIEAFCRQREVPLTVAANPREAESVIATLQPDLCIVSGWYWLIGRGLIDTVPLGWAGLHFSLLPRYRGFSPLVWALLRGERQVGVSLFQIAPGLDEGDLWAQRTVAVEPPAYVGEVLSACEDAGLELLRDSLPGMIDGSLRPAPQPAGPASYCARRTPEDGRIDFTRPAEDVVRFIRALSRPYPGAFTFHGGAKLTVWRARPDDRDHLGAPGQVVRFDEGGVYVACGDGKPAVLEEVECDGCVTPAGERIGSLAVRLRSDGGAA